MTKVEGHSIMSIACDRSGDAADVNCKYAGSRGRGVCPTDDPTSINDSELDNNSNNKPTSERVLNFAFFSFLVFMMLCFALMANSQSMLADSQAMLVDSLTFLVNMWAERIKKRPFTSHEMDLPREVREYRKEMQRLYLELIPPLISVATLVVVTILTVHEALATLVLREPGGEETVSAKLMLIFSALNLLLDGANVTCFARAGGTFGLVETDDVRRSVERSISDRRSEAIDETTSLLAQREEGAGTKATTCKASGKSQQRINLNMCSAWTHICADTMRSAAVLVAASVATLFPAVKASTADSCAALAVSATILASLLPLFQGLGVTVTHIVVLHQNEPIPLQTLSV